MDDESGRYWETIDHDYDNSDDADDDADDDGGYNTDGTDDTVIEDTANCYSIEVDGFRKPRQKPNSNYDKADFDDPEERKRKYKALCCKDICLWVVQNRNLAEGSFLTMEVHLHHIKAQITSPNRTLLFPVL
jgi:hypothetical protein